MRATKWNTDCERGGVWQRRIVRRGPDGFLLLSDVRHVIYPMLADNVTPGEPVLDYPAVLAGDQQSAVLTISSEMTTVTFPLESYRHKVTYVDPEIDDRVVLLRGYFTPYGDGSAL